MLLRPRQTEFVDKCIAAIDTHGNTMGVAATGFGKSICISAIIDHYIDRNPNVRACVLAHRNELVYQNQDKFQKFNPNISTSIVNATEKNWNGQVVFGTMQTLWSGTNLDRMSSMDILVIDEAHHVAAKSYLGIINSAKKKNPDIKLLGMTATPQRGDKKSLLSCFTNIADRVKITELINSGHLVPAIIYVVSLGIDAELESCRDQNDYDLDKVEIVMNKYEYNIEVARHWKEKALNRKTVIFCSTVQHAIDVMAVFDVVANIPTAIITGNTSLSDRNIIFDKMDRGEIQVIVNVNVLTEGWDYQPIDCVILLRPIAYKSSLIQMVGRGLRIVDSAIYPDVIKTDCIVLDFGISIRTHQNFTQEVDLNNEIIRGAQWGIETLENDEEEKEPEKKEILDFTTMEEFFLQENKFIKIYRCRWMKLENDNMISSAYQSWAYIYKQDEYYIALGGLENTLQLIAKTTLKAAMAAAEDWILAHETIVTQSQITGWSKRSATKKQLEYLKGIDNPAITMYEATCKIKYKFNKHRIKQLLQQSPIIEEVTND